MYVIMCMSKIFYQTEQAMLEFEINPQEGVVTIWIYMCMWAFLGMVMGFCLWKLYILNRVRQMFPKLPWYFLPACYGYVKVKFISIQAAVISTLTCLGSAELTLWPFSSDKTTSHSSRRGGDSDKDLRLKCGSGGVPNILSSFKRGMTQPDMWSLKQSQTTVWTFTT